MKKFFFLLLVVNLVIWLWSQREELRRVTGTAQPDFGAIRLIDEAELAARRQELPAAVQVSPPDAAAPADVEQRVATEPAAPVRTAAAEQQLAEAAATAPGAAERSHEPPSEKPAAAAPAVVAEPIAAAAPPDSVAQVRTDAEATAAGPATPPTPPEPAASTEAQASVSAAAESLPTALAEAAAKSAAVSPEPSVAERGSEIAQPAARMAESADAPAAPVTADSAGPPADETSPLGSAGTVPDAATSAPALPEEPAPAEVAPPDSVEAGAPAEPPPQEEAIVASEAVAPGGPAVAIEAPAEAREVLYLCESLGPFRERAAAERVSESLQAPLRAVELREERIARTSRYWVLAPLQPDQQALAEYIGRLEQAGVRDAWRIPSGPFAGRLAVGVFQAAANARKHADMLEAQGVAAEVHAPKDEERRYWIDYERPAHADAPELAARRNRPAPQIVPRDCGRVAGP